MLILVFIILFVTEVIHDSYKVGPKKVMSHISQILLFVMYAATGLLIQGQIFEVYLKILGVYVCLRIALFNLIFNLINKLPVFYIGTTDLFDILRKKLAERTNNISCYFELTIFSILALLLFLKI